MPALTSGLDPTAHQRHASGSLLRLPAANLLLAPVAAAALASTFVAIGAPAWIGACLGLLAGLRVAASRRLLASARR